MRTPETTTCCLLSFEGPDRYALAGGLGVRVTHLAETLARRGFDTHLFFVGDPQAPGREVRAEGRLTLHRWCQWISAYHPAGVYAGEEGKLGDFNASLPSFLLEHVLRPALAQGRLPVILAEEWHTAEAVVRLHQQLRAAGLGQRCALLWNANNTMSFHRVDWPRLQQAAQLTTVSRYMKHLMWTRGLNPLVIPNGIPAALLAPVDAGRAAALRALLDPAGDAVVLFKVGRFDPAKRWLMAVEAAAQLKAQGQRVAFALCGGVEPHGAEVLARAQALGLSLTTVHGQPETWDDLLALLHGAPAGDVYNLRFFMTQEMLRPFYAGADAVLANSGHEPFGLAGLEAMAAGGLVFTGTTGEEYTLGGRCAVTLDTEMAGEIVSHIRALRADPQRARAMRRAARAQAAAFTWELAADVLMDKVAFVMQARGLVEPTRRGRSDGEAPPSPRSRMREAGRVVRVSGFAS